MAIISKGYTFGTTEQVTAAKLHALVDSAVIGSIANADIDASAAIVDTKLGQIATPGKVNGSAIDSLPNLPAGAGLIPSANLPSVTPDSDATLTFTDITTNNSSTTKHGFLKKLSNVATEFMNGVGNWVAITIDAILPTQTGNSGKFLTTNGSVASWGSTASVADFTAGDTILASLDTAINSPATLLEAQRFTIGNVGGTFRVTYRVDWKNQSEGHVRIYKNGSPFGTDRTQSSAVGVIDYSEDLAFSAGDTCELWGQNGSIALNLLSLFRLKVASVGTVRNDYPTNSYNNSTASRVYSGVGAPVSTYGNVGDIYLNISGGASTTLYVKTGASTWTAK